MDPQPSAVGSAMHRSVTEHPKEEKECGSTSRKLQRRIRDPLDRANSTPRPNGPNVQDLSSPADLLRCQRYLTFHGPAGNATARLRELAAIEPRRSGLRDSSRHWAATRHGQGNIAKDHGSNRLG
jgi:hypothetical protein